MKHSIERCLSDKPIAHARRVEFVGNNIESLETKAFGFIKRNRWIDDATEPGVDVPADRKPTSPLEYAPGKALQASRKTPKRRLTTRVASLSKLNLKGAAWFEDWSGFRQCRPE